MENPVYTRLLGRRCRRNIGVHQLGKAEDSVERAAKLVAHAGKKFRLREIGFFRQRFCALQLDILFLQHVVQSFALRFDLLARSDVTQDAGKESLAAQLHFAYRYFQGKNAAILTLTRDLASEAGGARFLACTVIPEGIIGTLSIKFGYQQAESSSNEFRGGLAKHFLSGRVNSLNDARTGMDGDDAVHHSIENRLD